jgi:hypothetical protein
MSDEKNNNKSLKATKWKVGGTIAVALLTAYITYINNRAADDAELQKTIAKQDTLINEFNSNIIPTIQRHLEQLRQDHKELKEDESAARERIAKLEGILEAILRKVKIKDIVVPAFPTEKPEKESSILKVLGLKKKEEKKPKKIKLPTLQTQQKILGPSLDSPILERSLNYGR